MALGSGRKAQFEKLLQELKTLVLGGSVGFAAGVAEELENLANKGASFSALPRTAYTRYFSAVAPPKSSTTLINQMTLFIGAFSFYWHAIDRYSFRPKNEALRKAVLDPIVFAMSKELAEMVVKSGMKTTAEAAVAAVQPLSLRYAGARALADPKDVENSAVFIAGYSIVNDTELPLTAEEKAALAGIVVAKLLEGIAKLDLPKRIKALETLL